MSEPAHERQQRHYETIHEEYERHYYDAAAMAFRDRFVYDVLFRGLDLNGKTVGDLASGSGHNSLAVLTRFPRAEVIGFDISPKALEGYRDVTGSRAYEVDLTAGIDHGVRVDVAMIFGGLHHCVANLPMTFQTISQMVRPGGLLLMWEPNRRYLLQGVRRMWYRFDKYFDAETEAALDHDQVAALARRYFTPMDCRYSGGPAYFLIANSLLFRIPHKWKEQLAPGLFQVERAYNLLPGRWGFPYFLARWRRKDS